MTYLVIPYVNATTSSPQTIFDNGIALTFGSRVLKASHNYSQCDEMRLAFYRSGNAVCYGFVYKPKNTYGNRYVYVALSTDGSTPEGYSGLNIGLDGTSVSVGNGWFSIKGDYNLTLTDATALVNIYESKEAFIGAVTTETRYPITYYPTNVTLSPAPSEAAVGDTVTVGVTVPDGYSIRDPSSNIVVRNNGVIVPHVWNGTNSQFTFIMPDPS